MPEVSVTEEVVVAVTTTEAVVELTVVAQPQAIEVGIIGPQGPRGEPGPTGSNALANLDDVDVSTKVDKSVVYYDQTAEKFVANSIHTIITLTDGGNF